ncbi:MAG: hypothetical protein JSS99_06455 [Actinobacteria bacterium]|nr:hypothetical protein [Actinomycetota bacterium]
MHGLDEAIAGLARAHGSLVVLAVALLLGLRHATDPDHLAAVSTLIATEPADGARRAGRLGLAWGLGHATALFALGLPLVLLGVRLPEPAQRGAELLVGLAIVALAVRLLVRWRRGRYHAHVHRHGAVAHRHLHAHAAGGGHAHAAGGQAHAAGGHAQAPGGRAHAAGGEHAAGHHAHAAGGPAHAHRHEPAARLGRSPLQAYGIGLLHGIGGSAGVGLLLLAAIPGRAQAAGALVAFALAAAASMATLSYGFGRALARAPARRRTLAFAPALATAALAFGAWYALTAVTAAPL